MAATAAIGRRGQTMSFASITQRFVVWFLLVSLLPILLLSYSLLHTFEKELQHTVFQQISAIADKKADQIDSYLAERVHHAMVLQQGSGTLQAMREFAAVFARDGVESAAYRRLDASYRDYFKRFVGSAGLYDLFLITPQGTVVYSQTHEADFATNLFTGPYRGSGLAKVTRNALSSLESNISEFELYAPSGNAIAAFIAVPIMSQGKLAGVLALQIDNERVFQVLLDRTGLGDSGETVVARSDDEHTALVVAPLKSEPDAAMKRKISLDDKQRAMALQHALNGERGSGIAIDYGGHPVVAAWRYLPRMGWGMVVKMDTAEVLAPFYRVRIIGFVVLGLALLCALIAAFILGRRVVVPLKYLSNSAQDIAAGKFGQRVPVLGRDELGQLAASFNTMAERLQSSYAKLEQQVTQRTAELSQSLENLRVSAGQLNEAQRLAKVGSWKLDIPTGALVWSDEVFHIFEIDKAQFGATYEAFLNVVHPDDRERVNDAYTGSLKTRKPYELIHRLRMGDGRIKWVQELCESEFAVDGKPLFSRGTVQDITERKHAEEMLQNSNEELERRVELRTAMLLAAKEEAEQANLSKSVFLTSMSHELRTPLNAILGYAQLMQIDTSLPQNVVENATEIKQAGDFLLHLLNDILDLARIESGRLQLRLEHVSLSVVMKNCYAQNIQAAITHNVMLRVAENCSAYHVTADQRGLTQVLNNLISNAIKYNRAGGRVNVSCTEVVRGKVRISVIDTGIGIAADKQPQLFQPFNRLGAELGNIEGTGIGLVISRKLMEGMQGAIGMESVDGLGATFWLELPVSEHESAGTLTAAAMDRSIAKLHKAPRVLVAEDYVPNQNVLLLQLQTIGCEVDIAADGAAALSMWRKKPYDLILTDIDMPVMKGTEFAQAVRNEERSKGGHIPMVAITAISSTSELKRYQSAGIDEALSKPLSMDALRACLARWLGDITSTPSRLHEHDKGYSADSSDANAILNLNYLYHILGQVNLAQARILVDTFMRTADEGLQALSLQMDDAALVAKEMHKQKSSARTVGALHYANLAAKLEQQTKDEKFTGIASSLAALRQALHEVEAASANLLETPRHPSAELEVVPGLAGVNCHSALVVDDDLVVLQQVKAMLDALGVSEVLTAINGVEANRVLATRGGEIEVLVCDLSMPEMDGVELIRRFGETGFKGGLILISGADEKIISTVNKLAVLQGVRVLGQLQKPVSAAQLAVLLAHAEDLPAREQQAAAGPVVSRKAIRAAMAASQFSIWFQPKVDATSLRTVGLEALARWQLPNGKFISPDNFITVAEREGLIGELSQMLVSLALTEAAKLYAAGFPLKVAINLSGAWLNDLNLPDFILNRTRAAGLRAADVILEVTETGVMEDLTTALDVLSRLRLKGFGLSIDDFGIGYSSFEQLGRIPFTEMKLDRSFVCKGAEDGAARAILESSMDMAHKLNLSTVAEGVETELDLKLVRSLGCDLIQGYLIARPMPVKDLIVWLGNAKSKVKKQ
jgi:EAL domain-containing protein (putative c-di-GMP-specific phosphodiesterase class I)/signal transduction histidine kinase/DNA-binding response OmpR family regulator